VKITAAFAATALSALILTGSACSADSEADDSVPSGTVLQLVDIYGWTVLDAASDPFSDRIDDVVCPAEGYGPDEPLAFEVALDVCNYFVGSQPLTEGLVRGQQVELIVGHGLLAPNASDKDPGRDGELPETPVAHVAVMLGERLLWEREIDIPTASRFYVTQHTMTADVPVGTPVIFHVHNHGPNTYRFVEMTTVVP
jgi:hypothetical protein